MACYLIIATVCVCRCVSYSVSQTNSCMSGIEEVVIVIKSCLSTPPQIAAVSVY